MPAAAFEMVAGVSRENMGCVGRVLRTSVCAFFEMFFILRVFWKQKQRGGRGGVARDGQRYHVSPVEFVIGEFDHFRDWFKKGCCGGLLL